MHRNIAQKFSGSCFLLVRKREDNVLFLGTAFIIHEEGYLLTASHLLEENYEGIMAVRPSDPDDFSPLSLEMVHAMPLDTVKVDHENNTALLRFSGKMAIETPDHLIGSSDSVMPGSSVLGFGFPFGHRDLHNMAVQSCIIGSKVKLKERTNLFLVDTAIHAGMAGGPLVSGDDGRVVGILVGRFLPHDEGGDFIRGNHPDFETSFSYAVSIEYGRAMLEELGFEII